MFKDRSYKKELLDEQVIQRDLLFQNLKELNVINKYLGGHRVSISGLKCALRSLMPTDKVLQLVDIGCGGGDSIRALAKWADSKSIPINYMGVDLKEDCIAYCFKNTDSISNAVYVCDDYKNIFDRYPNIDLVHAALFCHHFSESEIINLIELCQKNNTVLIINDLERNPIAYYAIRLLTSLFSNSILVKNDAPLSVLRGFKKKEWIQLLSNTTAVKYSINNKWAFRHLIIIYPND